MNSADDIRKTFFYKYWDKFPIFGSHVQRIGFFRVLLGVCAMYLTIPLIIILHILFVEIVFQRILTPLLKLEATATGHYLFMDRHLIEGLPVVDKITCSICSYASGCAALIYEKLSAIERINLSPPLYGTVRLKISVMILMLMVPFAWMLSFLGMDFLYGFVIEKAFGYDRPSENEITRKVLANGSENDSNPLILRCLKFYKRIISRLLTALALVESSWCPLKHPSNRADSSYPAHHVHFFKPYEIEEMSEMLKSKGTVLTENAYETGNS